MSYHLHAQTGSRTKGQSAAAKHAYISAVDKYDKKQGVVYTESGNMPEWASDARAYWQAADLHERANARLYKEVEFSLPRELTQEQQRQAARDFAQKTARTSTGQPLPYSLGIHDKGDGNPHCHVMISERVYDGLDRTPEKWFSRADKNRPDQTGAPKTRDLFPKEWLDQTRESWAVTGNQWLAKAGYAPRLDHRSNAARGIDRPPGKHIGPRAFEMESRGIRTERGDAYRERLKLQEEWDQAEAEAAAVAAELAEIEALLAETETRAA